MFQTILPHYRYVKVIVERYRQLNQDDFPEIEDWHYLGKLVLLDLLEQEPHLLLNPIALQLSYRLALIKILGKLCETKTLMA